MKFLPFLQWRSMVNRRTTRADITAGLTGAVIVLPQGVAFAAIAGLPPEYGLYSAIVPAVIAALFGSSHHLISGPTTAISIVIFTTISHFAEPLSAPYIEMVLTLTFLAGLFQFALGMARLGALVNFVSHSVVVGFTAGAAILIGSGQLAPFLGVSVPKHQSFLHTLQALLPMLPNTNQYVFVIAAVTLITAILFKIFLPRWPGMLFAMITGSLLALVTNASHHGALLVGSLPGHLPPLSAPDLSIISIRRLVPGALAVAMLGLAEAVSIARSVSTRSQQRIDSNQEFIGQGLSNIVGSFFSSYAASGSFTRTGVNYNAGAKTPMAAIYAALSLTVILLLIAPLTSYLPIASMAGILLLVAYNLIDMHHIKTIIKTSKPEAAVMGVTFLATLFVQLEFAIYIGVILSMLLYLNRTSHPRFVILAPDPESRRREFTNISRKPLPECPQLKVLRIDGSLFFGAVNHAAEGLNKITKESPEQTHILIIGNGINFIDVAGCEMLAAEARNLHLSGRELYLCELKSEVTEVLERGGYHKKIGNKNILRTKQTAIKKLVPQLDPLRCYHCRLRIFNECADMPDETKDKLSPKSR